MGETPEATLLLGSLTLVLLAYQLDWLQKQITAIQNMQRQAKEEIKQSIEGLKLQPEASGELTATGAEDTMIEIVSGKPFVVSGWISLANMQTGDTVVVNEYHDGKLFASRTYKDSQSQPQLYLMPLRTLSSIKVTLQQTSGTLKTFKYEFLKGEVS